MEKYKIRRNILINLAKFYFGIGAQKLLVKRIENYFIFIKFDVFITGCAQIKQWKKFNEFSIIYQAY